MDTAAFSIFNLCSLDSSYQHTIGQPQIREASLLTIQRDLRAWSSMVPNCVTMAYNADTATVFRNNGMVDCFSIETPH